MVNKTGDLGKNRVDIIIYWNSGKLILGTLLTENERTIANSDVRSVEATEKRLFYPTTTALSDIVHRLLKVKENR
ncbi:hypothetical protein OUZ56_025534 [Daphnia magna]|uniref:Uncharacterized protein n=1 Tax=Daphnia magna TaxID=35525 RepID=A0ABQ9ZL45_9CRUS|nr:hypothetical protein OUZ56_025534 [Daphnia magna]